MSNLVDNGLKYCEAPSGGARYLGLCCRFDEAGRCIEVQPCRAAAPTHPDDDCLALVEERAWSSPLFVDFAR